MTSTDLPSLIAELTEFVSLKGVSDSGIILIKNADFIDLMSQISPNALSDWLMTHKFLSEPPAPANVAVFRKWVTVRRKSRGWDQATLGSRVSLSQGSISRFEKGNRDFEEPKLNEIRAVLISES